MLAVRPALRAKICVLGLAGGLGVPGLMGPGCMWGRCCRRLRDDLGGPFPVSVPFLSVFSRADAMVDWRASLDGSARLREVGAAHGDMVWSPRVLSVVVEELARVAGRRPLPAGQVRAA